jgi:hypothetical protein
MERAAGKRKFFEDLLIFSRTTLTLEKKEIESCVYFFLFACMQSDNKSFSWWSVIAVKILERFPKKDGTRRRQKKFFEDLLIFSRTTLTLEKTKSRAAFTFSCLLACSRTKKVFLGGQ